MEKRGIATAAVAISVVVIVIITALVCYFLATKEGVVEVSVYTGAVENAEAIAQFEARLENYGISGIEAKAYTSTQDVATIASWYRSEMAEGGWTKENDLVKPKCGFLAFKRGDDEATIMLENEGTHTTIEICSGSSEKIEATKEAVIKPDISISSDDITYHEYLPGIRATVHNVGYADAGELKVAFYVDGERVDSSIASVAAGESGTAQISRELSPGDHEIRVVVDSENQIDESNEGNNEATKQIWIASPPKPDLSISSDDIALGVRPIIRATVHNIGYVDVGELKVAFYLDGERVDSSVSSVAAGESATAQVSRDLGPGDHTIRVVVDVDNQIDELDEGNNEATKQITIAPPSKPDLSISSDDITYDAPTIRATIHNIGNADAGEFWVGFEVDGEPVGGTWITGIAAGGSAVA